MDNERRVSESGMPFKLPADHKPGMEVPKGGSMCANCKYLGEDQKTCTEENFISWNGSNVIPGEVDSYCSDWWQRANRSDEMKPLTQKEANGMSLRDILDSVRPAEERQ